ncbi:MAG: YfcE family phosphodiesterase [Cyclobacteriaceae bacterium]
MKLGILSDLHGNNFAFDRVLEVLRAENIEKLLVLGDVCGYYYGTEKILDELKKWDCIFINGNHERMLEAYLDGDDIARQRVVTKYGSSFKYLKLQTTQFFKGLKDQEVIVECGKRILLCHGSPWNSDLYVYPDKISEYSELFENVDADIVLMGHTHYQMVTTIGNKMVINPGSVGQSRLVGSTAFWGVLNLQDDQVIYEPRAANYDPLRLISQVKRFDPTNEYLINVLNR